jgi:hypothetical protein
MGAMRARRQTLAVALVALGSIGASAGCSDDADEAPDPSPPLTAEDVPLGRIDGPATVDPSYDPFTTVAPTTGG